MENRHPEFNTIAESSSARYYTSILVDGENINVDVNNFVYEGASNPDDDIKIGSACSNSISFSVYDPQVILEGKEVEVRQSVSENDSSDYIRVGFFLIQKPTSDGEVTTYTGYDRMILFERTYFSDLTFPAKASDVVDEICKNVGINFSTILKNDYTISQAPAGYTFREVIGYIAALYGTNAIINRDGELEFIWYTETDYVLTGDRIYQGGVQFDSEFDFTLSTISCTVNTDGESTTLYSGGGTQGISIENPFMTQEILDDIFTKLSGFNFRTLSVNFLGDWRLDIGDIITVTKDSVDYRVPIMQITHKSDGGVMTTVKAVAKTETESEYSAAGPTTKALERYYADLVLINEALINKLDVYDAEITYATIQSLEAFEANVSELIAKCATIENLEANYATITQLNAATARIADLEANSATISDLEANYATITQLNAANANIDALTTTAANIKSLLAGNAGVGDLQAIHLTSANVVIDDAIINDAMISDLSASKITAGDIYTNKVRIYGDENKLLSIVDNTIQISDGTVVRVQIGEDGDGDYNLYLWDANGNMLWNATGVTESGLNDGIIKDIAVADDAAIKGTKLDIESVAECLNEDGSLVIDASQVTINDTTLAAAYTTIIQTSDLMQDALKQLESEKTVADVKTYYCLTGDGGILLDESGAELLDENGDPIYDFDLETCWTTEPLTASEDQCLWVRYLVTYTDGTEEWTTPVCLTDTALREKTSVLITEFEVVQGQIEAKIWQTDIEKATAELEDDINQTADALKGEITTLSDKYTTLKLTVDGLTTRVGDVETTLTTKADSSTVTNLSSRVSTLEQTVDGFKTTVSDIESTLNTKADSSTVSTLSTKVSTLEQAVDGFKTTVSNLQTTVSDNYTDLSTKYSTLTQTVDGFEAEVTDLQTTVSDNYTELSGQVMDLYATTSGFGVSLTSLEQTVGQLSDQTSVEDATLYYAATGAQDALTDESGEGLLDENGEPLYDFTLITDWTTEPPEIGEDQYLWMRYYKRYTDGTEEWTTPVMVTDAIVREKTSTLITELEVLQGKITAKIWQTDIDQAVGALEESASSDLNATASEIYDYVAEQIMTVNSITSTVLESYVLTTDFEETVETLQSTIEQNAESVTISIENVNEYISTVDDDLQAKYDTVSKYFTFDEDGLLISSGDTGSLSLRLDNDQIAFVKDDNVLAHWDGDYLYTGNIYVQVTEQARFGNYAWIPRSDGSLMLLKVGE